MEFIKNSTTLLARMALGIPDAYSIAGNVDGVSVVGVDASVRGTLYILNGADKGKKVPIGDAGLAIGWDQGASAVFTEYYYVNLFGSNRPLQAGDFQGLRFSASIGASAVIEGGFGLSIAPIDPANGIYVIGKSHHYGVSPPGISGNVNFGWTWPWKN